MKRDAFKDSRGVIHTPYGVVFKHEIEPLELVEQYEGRILKFPDYSQVALRDLMRRGSYNCFLLSTKDHIPVVEQNLFEVEKDFANMRHHYLRMNRGD